MGRDELIRHLESLLFVAAEPAEVAQLAAALGVKPGEVEEALAELSDQYASRGLRVQRRGQRVALATAAEAAPYVEKVLGLSATKRRPAEAHSASERVRLHKAIAAAGISSRRQAEALIRSGRVSVNGHVVREMGVQVEPTRDEIRVNGQILQAAQKHTYLM